MSPTVLTTDLVAPSRADLDHVIAQLEASWTARLTVRRQSKDDVGIREIYVSLDGERLAMLHAGQEVSREIKPGPHRLRVHNTLFWKTVDFNIAVGEHLSFVAINRKSFATFSVWAFFIGTNMVYLSVERERFYESRP